MIKRLITALVFLTVFNTAVSGATSRETRENDYIQIHHNIIGFGIVGFNIRPYGMSAFWSEKLSFGYEQANGRLRYGAGVGISSGDQSIIVTGGEDGADLEYSALYARWFLANSFNLLLKGSRFKVEGNLEVEESPESLSSSSYRSNSKTVSYDVDMTTSLVSLGVGNQWILANWLVIGADWLIYPIYRKTDYSYTVLDNKDSHDDPDKLFEKGVHTFEYGAGIQIVSFYLGFSF